MFRVEDEYGTMQSNPFMFSTYLGRGSYLECGLFFFIFGQGVGLVSGLYG